MKKFDLKANIPGKKGSIARLIVLGLISVIAVLSSVLTLPKYIGRKGYGPAVLEAFAGCGLLLLLAAGMWGLMKWIGFIAPKSFGLAKRFWQAWRPLTFFGVYLKACVWLLIAMVPVTASTMLITPLTSIGFLVAGNLNLLSALGMFLAGAVLVVLVGFVDMCKLRQVSPVESAKALWKNRKVAQQ